MTYPFTNTLLDAAFGSHLNGVIEELERGSPDDPMPGASRATAALLRVLESEGPTEMVESIMASFHAAVGALAVMSPTPVVAVEVMMMIAVKVESQWREAAAQAPRSGNTGRSGSNNERTSK